MAVAADGRLQTPPLGLYVHVPWCVRKCPYCDFNSHTAPQDLPMDRYIEALFADLECDLPMVWGRPVQSVYIGGGTPSLMSAGQVAALLSGIRARLDVRPGAEITLEANPGTVERDSFAAYAEAGVNRVSLGVQSFDERLLERIGRIHGLEDIERSLSSLARSGIPAFNTDLMYALPGQDRESALNDVRRALEAGAAHVSFYQLTIEPNTLFASKPPVLPEDDDAWRMQEAGQRTLEAAGYAQYEVSAFARPGSECRHNMNYWRYGDFLGVGAGAHGKLTLPAEGAVRRFVKQRHPTRYMQGLETGEWRAGQQSLDEGDLVFEFFLNQLRLREGVRVDDFEPRTGLSWRVVEARVADAIGRGLLEASGRRLKHTATGWKFLNDIQQIFLP